jgi:orotidine-5'-phosphate decarboxylase
VPGIGAQGGDAESAVTHGLANGVGLVNSSRGIIFAGENQGEAFAGAAGEAAKRLKRRLNEFR